MRTPFERRGFRNLSGCRDTGMKYGTERSAAGNTASARSVFCAVKITVQSGPDFFGFGMISDVTAKNRYLAQISVTKFVTVSGFSVKVFTIYLLNS